MNILIKRSLLALACTGLLAACNSDGDSAASTASVDTTGAVAVVNGTPISEARLSSYIERRTGGSATGLDPEMRDQVINELVNIELLAQRAESMGMDKQDPLKERLAFERSTSLADAAMTKYLEENPITEEEVRAEYEARKGELGGDEYKARHILVDDQETAEKLIAELDDGADFATLAKANSTEPGADQSGGDLGWFVPTQMVGPFAAAVQSMEKGSYSSEPVETQFGWHVVLLEDTREKEPPAFEEVSQRIERFLTSQKIQNYINELRGNADVNVNGETDTAEDVETTE